MRDERTSILIISMDAPVLKQLSRILKRDGHLVATAASGMEAVKRAAEQGFDLIVSDVRVAGLEGLQTLATVQESRPTARVIMLRDPLAMAAAPEPGVDDSLTLPLQERDVLRSVQRSLERARLQKDFERLLQQQWRDFAVIIKLLSTKLEAPDPYFEGHSRRVADLSGQIARRMNLPRKEIEILDLAAYLHDIGNLDAKLDILQKADALLGEEREEVVGSLWRRAEAYQRSLSSLRDVFRIIVHHHEWFNGEGVPARLKGDQIPLESRILCAAEAYDAMTSPRPYRDRLSSSEALKILSREAEQHFDPDVVAVLKSVTTEDREEAIPTDEERVREAAPTEKRRVGLLLSMAHNYLQNGNLDVAQKAYEDCVELLGDKRVPVRAEALNGLAMTHLQRDNLFQARAAVQLALTAAQGLSELQWARTLCTDALLESRQVRTEQAQDRLAEALATFEAWESRSDIGRTRLLQAMISLPDHGRDRFQDALAYLVEHDLMDVPTRERALFAPLFLKAYAQDWDRSKLEPFLLKFGESGLSAHLSSLSPALGRRLKTLLAAAGAEAQGEISIYAFGKFRLVCSGREVGDDAWKTRKARYLFAYLACIGEREAPDEKLMELFWPDHDPDKARQNLYAALSHIRKALDGFLQDAQKVVVANKGFYRLNSQVSLTVDVRDFERHYKVAAQALEANRLEEAMDAFQRAETLYQGEFLEGYYGDWAMPLRNSLEQQYHEILTRLMGHFAEKDRMPVVLDYVQRLLTLDPCLQEAHAHMMRAYMSLGRPEQAIRQYHVCCLAMKNELNVPPSPEISNLYLSIRG